MKKKSTTKVFFQDFSETEISDVMNMAEIVTYPKDSMLFKRGDESDSFYIISTGELEVFSHQKGEEVQIAIIRHGSVVGEIGFLDNQERTASARAISNIVALRVSHKDFAQLEKDNIKLAIKLILEIESILSDRIRFSDKLLVDYQTVQIDDKFLQKINTKSRQTF